MALSPSRSSLMFPSPVRTSTESLSSTSSSSSSSTPETGAGELGSPPCLAFGSDNYSGVDLRVFESLCAIEGSAKAYGDDPITQKSRALVAHQFNTVPEGVSFINTGTAANVMAIMIGTRRTDAVLCPNTAHIQENEGGSPEFITGNKLILCGTLDGKLDLALADRLVDQHKNSQLKPPIRMISISIPTELGTIISEDELKKIVAFCKERELFLHIDGARLSNAADFCQKSFAELVKGADLVSFGLTKNGGMNAEAIIVLNPTLLQNVSLPNLQKQLTQVQSKQRYQAIQFITFFEEHDGKPLWKKNASIANRMAQELRRQLTLTLGMTDEDFAFPTDSNMVFAWIPEEIFFDLVKRYTIYEWTVLEKRKGMKLARFVTSFSTTRSDISMLVEYIKSLLSGYLTTSSTSCSAAPFEPRKVPSLYLTETGSDLDRAAFLIQSGELVAFPTETVFGLGANALSDIAVQKIFLAKGRPSDNPLIVHVSSFEMVKEVADLSLLDDRQRELYFKASKLFWPGPLTILLPKSHRVSTLATAQVPTVAVRMPNHPVALSLIQKAGVPLAAPSANLSGRPSPTSVQHVVDDLQGKVPYILTAENCEVGLESTVVDIFQNPPVVLRPGGISLSSLRTILPEIVLFSGGHDVSQPTTPGMKYRHYSPTVPITLFDMVEDASREDCEEIMQTINSFLTDSDDCGAAVALVRTRQDIVYPDEFLTSKRVHFVNLLAKHPEDSLALVASGMFDALRQIEKIESIRRIFFEGVKEVDMGIAIMNRIRKAASTIQVIPHFTQIE